MRFLCLQAQLSYEGVSDRGESPFVGGGSKGNGKETMCLEGSPILRSRNLWLSGRGIRTHVFQSTRLTAALNARRLAPGVGFRSSDWFRARCEVRIGGFPSAKVQPPNYESKPPIKGNLSDGKGPGYCLGDQPLTQLHQLGSSSCSNTPFEEMTLHSQ